MPKGSETADLVWPFINEVNRLPCCVAFRLHSGKARVRGGFMKNNPKGTPDVLVIAAGAPISFEAKKPGEEPTIEQRAVAVRVSLAGAAAYTYTDMDHALRIVKATLRARGVIR